MKNRVLEESQFDLSTICRKLKLPAKDNKLRATDCANTENMLHIVQYIPSPKVVVFREWLASLGAERIEEVNDPEAAFLEWRERAILAYVTQGYSQTWATNRVDSITARKRLTSQWAMRGITSGEIPILTDRLHTKTFDVSIEEHKGIKGFEVTMKQGQPRYKGDLRPALTSMELALSTFSENLSAALHEQHRSQGFSKIADDVDVAGGIAGDKRRETEAKIGQPVVSPVNMIKERDGGLWGLLPQDNSEDQ